jgi:hypothetical protein
VEEAHHHPRAARPQGLHGGAGGRHRIGQGQRPGNVARRDLDEPEQSHRHLAHRHQAVGRQPGLPCAGEVRGQQRDAGGGGELLQLRRSQRQVGLAGDHAIEAHASEAAHHQRGAPLDLTAVGVERGQRRQHGVAGVHLEQAGHLATDPLGDRHAAG